MGINRELLTPTPHPDYEAFTVREIQQDLERIDNELSFAKEHGAETLFIQWLADERDFALGELARRNGQPNPFLLSSPLCQGKAGKQESPSYLPLISSRDLLPKEGEESVDWLVDNLIPKGCVVLLTAPPGSYKTFFALSLGRSVGQGEPFLGRALEAASVTYVDRENPRSVLSSRLKAVGPSPNLTLWPLWAEPEPPLLGDKSYLTLASDRSLLVFDSLRRFHTGSENAPEEMAVVMGYLRELTKPGATVLVLHHTGKAEGSIYRGTTEILAGVDVAFSLEKDKQQTRVLGTPVPLTLRCVKHRFIEEPTLSLEFAVEGERVVFRDVTASRQEEREEDKREKLEEIQEVIQKLEREQGTPNQTQVLRALKNTLNIGKNAALNLLGRGEGSHWRSEPKDGSRRYQTLSPFPETIGRGKEESLGGGWEQVL
ncbi:MAG: AAA family ATPase [Deltaproteobacteria bacterium]|nr:AAA family ATPase [Deltaproteobacteria bacterium]